mmetsp:Transcript_64393/g.106592  ORF Transcript_64393/g.106592 Transcript_64393/m.106592 type:complete len:210 (-) Transcript_64393:37-666(-)
MAVLLRLALFHFADRAGVHFGVLGEEQLHPTLLSLLCVDAGSHAGACAAHVDKRRALARPVAVDARGVVGVVALPPAGRALPSFAVGAIFHCSELLFAHALRTRLQELLVACRAVRKGFGGETGAGTHFAPRAIVHQADAATRVAFSVLALLTVTDASQHSGPLAVGAFSFLTRLAVLDELFFDLPGASTSGTLPVPKFINHQSADHPQ